MKRKLVAFMLIMAVCANLHTTVFAARETTWSEEEADGQWQPETFTGTTTPSANAPSEGTPSDNTAADGDSKVTEVPVETGKDEPIDNIIAIGGGTNVITGGNTETETPVETTEGTDTATTENSEASTTVSVKEEKETPVGTDSTIDKNGNAEIKNTSAGMTVDIKKDDKEPEKPEEKDEKTLRNEKIQQELKDYAKSIGFTDNRRYGKDAVTNNHEYEVEPVIGEDSCVAGKLADSTLKEGLDLINMIRKAAGLGEVTLDGTYNEYAQNGALIMKASEGTIINGIDYGGLSHNPIRANNVTDEQNALGIKGTRNGNIGLGHTSLTESILNGYMYDGDRSNIAAMGHRRWILNPTMGKVGFGQVDRYNCMYAHDNSNPDAKIEDFVTWPAENMPIELMSYANSQSINGITRSDMPWTCQLGTNYKITTHDQLTITVTYPDGHKYIVPQNCIYCNNQKYGYTNGCITFRADDFNGTEKGSFEGIGSNYSVKIDGVLDKNGNKTSIEYDVNFFNLF